MNIIMSGLDHSKAAIAVRERLSFTKNGVLDMNARISRRRGVQGAVLISTCNRTELYLSCDDYSEINPGRLLCEEAGVSYAAFADAFTTRGGEYCVRHLMEVSCGLKSQILGEDQILTQVKTAATLAREAGSQDAILETLFRTASSCGKAVKTMGRLTERSTSAAHSAVAVMEQNFGQIKGKKAVVIGNGEMGRLAAGLLQEKGCKVTVTLRSYHHGQTLVPAGCDVIAYEKRYEAMDGADMLVSATTSPHYTVSTDEFSALTKPRRLWSIWQSRAIYSRRWVSLRRCIISTALTAPRELTPRYCGRLLQ